MVSQRYFSRSPKRAGRSARYDRRVRNAEAAGSNPARSTFTPARPHFESPLTLEVILDLKKQGKAEETINGYSKRLRHLAKNTDINNPRPLKNTPLTNSQVMQTKKHMLNVQVVYTKEIG